MSKETKNNKEVMFLSYNFVFMTNRNVCNLLESLSTPG